MINIAELLKDVTKGMKLYSPLFGEVKFVKVEKQSDYPIVVTDCKGNGKSFTEFGVYFADHPDAECLLFPSKDCRTWEGWKAPIKPKFKVGDWIVTDYGKVSQVVSVDKDGDGCTLDDGVYFSGSWCNMYHLWAIQDAKDGDILALNGKPFIYSHKYEKNYCYIDDCGQFRVNFSLVLEGNCVCPANKQERDLLFSKMREVGYEWDKKKKELKKIPVKPKFNVGDWLYPNCNGIYPVLVTDYDKWCGYQLQDGSDRYHLSHKIVDDEYHLWSIADAKDGDILSAKIDGDDYILIFKQIKDGWIETYGHYYITIDKFCTPTQMFCRDYQGTLYPATQEQRGLLFQKMREAGYEWDADKKELKKILPHYDISNFHAGMPVLVRCTNSECWKYGIYSHYGKYEAFSTEEYFICVGSQYIQCIPFEGNEKLLGTTDPCDECYVNW